MAVPSPEVLLFTRPDENRKNIFITDIETNKEEITILETLRGAFTEFGLINEALLFKSHLPNFSNLKRKSRSTAENDGSEITTPRYFAIVKFYSVKSAARSLREVKVTIDGLQCKLSYCRRKDVKCNQQLYVTRCYELANFYLGFDGWTTNIKMMWMEEYEGKVKCVCHVNLSITRHSLLCEGVGEWEESIISIATKGNMCSKSHKIAYNRAIENAFSKIVLVVMGDGRVYVDINVAMDTDDKDVGDEELLKITEVDNKEDEETPDDHNLSILEDLFDS